MAIHDAAVAWRSGSGPPVLTSVGSRSLMMNPVRLGRCISFAAAVQLVGSLMASLYSTASSPRHGFKYFPQRHLLECLALLKTGENCHIDQRLDLDAFYLQVCASSFLLLSQLITR
jgi:hypothetical protein